jgi:hypothetical protein
VQLGENVVRLTAKPAARSKGAVSERLVLASVGTIANLCSLNLAQEVVFVWWENLRLGGSDNFLSARAKPKSAAPVKATKGKGKGGAKKSKA